jgi:hypothetical protein
MLLSFSVGSAEFTAMMHVCSTTAFIFSLVRCHVTIIPIIGGLRERCEEVKHCKTISIFLSATGELWHQLMSLSCFVQLSTALVLVMSAAFLNSYLLW